MHERWMSLAMPPHALRGLEEKVCWLGQWQNRLSPRLEAVRVCIYIGNHGFLNRAVSAWDMGVTSVIADQIDRGQSAINAIAASQHVDVVPYRLCKLEPTRDFTVSNAMDEAAFLRALQVGYGSVRGDEDLLCLGEAGIGNTLCAAAICCALTQSRAAQWCSVGASPPAYLERRRALVDRALTYHQSLKDPLEIARCLGGYEMAAIMGAVVAARIYHVPVIVDGFVTLSAVAPLAFYMPRLMDHLLLSHITSRDGKTSQLAKKIGIKACLQECSMRLGEGTAAVMSVPYFRAALACYTMMGTL